MTDLQIYLFIRRAINISYELGSLTPANRSRIRLPRYIQTQIRTTLSKMLNCNCYYQQRAMNSPTLGEESLLYISYLLGVHLGRRTGIPNAWAFPPAVGITFRPAGRRATLIFSSVFNARP